MRTAAGADAGSLIAVLLASVPIAILATMTRAVWLSFVRTVLVLVFLSKNRMLQEPVSDWFSHPDWGWQ